MHPKIQALIFVTSNRIKFDFSVKSKINPAKQNIEKQASWKELFQKILILSDGYDLNQTKKSWRKFAMQKLIFINQESENAKNFLCHLISPIYILNTIIANNHGHIKFERGSDFKINSHKSIFLKYYFGRGSTHIRKFIFQSRRPWIKKWIPKKI